MIRVETFTMFAAALFLSFVLGASVGGQMAEIESAQGVPLDVRGER